MAASNTEQNDNPVQWLEHTLAAHGDIPNLQEYVQELLPQSPTYHAADCTFPPNWNPWDSRWQLEPTNDSQSWPAQQPAEPVPRAQDNNTFVLPHRDIMDNLPARLLQKTSPYTHNQEFATPQEFPDLPESQPPQETASPNVSGSGSKFSP